jgi:hypothetical protein
MILRIYISQLGKKTRNEAPSGCCEEGQIFNSWEEWNIIKTH